MMKSIITTDNISRALFIIKLHAHVISTNDNSCDYSLFNMHLVSNYINNQLIYYFITDIILITDQAEFQ